MRWLEAHYRHALDMFGFEYPTSYVLIADIGVLTLCAVAVVQRAFDGLSGPAWIWIAAAVAAELVPHLACLYLGWKPRVLALPVFTIAGVVLFWQVPVQVDVATLLLPLGATIAAAVASRRDALISTVGLALTALGGGIAGVIAQGWLVFLMVGFGGVVGYLLQKQVLLLRSERLAQTQQMALDRAAIAGEVHDVLAHSLSIMMLNVTAARRALREHQDLPEAAEALEDAEQVGRSAMRDVRRTVELLRSADAAAPTAPQPGLADLAELIDGFRRAGVRIDAEMVETGQTISAGTGLAVYRVVQESLSNACRHAPGASVSVSVAPESDELLAVRIGNDVTTGAGRAHGGSGLTGMASRVEHCGGTFRAGIVDGKWWVEALFPADAHDADDAVPAMTRDAAGFPSGAKEPDPAVWLSDGPSVAGSV